MMKGLIFMPDINGFTSFVKSMDITTGAAVTRDLLNVIVDNNYLELQLCEIEGDAILFYKLGSPLPISVLLNCFEKIIHTFGSRYQYWKYRLGIQADLSLKLIIHYGDIEVYEIRGFRKLYGEMVIESHRLLKTRSSSSDYILLTEDYIKALQLPVTDPLRTYRNYTCLKSHLNTGPASITFHLLSPIKHAVHPCDTPDDRAAINCTALPMNT